MELFKIDDTQKNRFKNVKNSPHLLLKNISQSMFKNVF